MKESNYILRNSRRITIKKEKVMTENPLQIKALFEQYLAENDKFENGGVKALGN